MSFTGNDNLVRELMPMVAELLPAEAIRRARSVDHAITQDGYVDPNAILLSGAAIIDGILDDTLYSTSSTVTYTTGATIHAELPPGSWSVMLIAMSRGTNSSGSTIDYQTVLQGIAGQLITRVGPTAGASPFFSLQKQQMDGAQSVTGSVRFKSDSAGTTQVFDTVLILLALKTA